MLKNPIIEFKNYSFQYNAQAEPTIEDLNLTIYQGEKILICGLSGSGKSTLGHCLNGLIPHSYKGTVEGSLTIKGENAVDQTLFERSKSVGTVLQDSDGQFVGLTVGEDIAFVLENNLVPLDTMRTIVQEKADFVGMGSFLQHAPQRLSGGQKQRVALAGVLASDADILLFDEPLANLDPQAGETAVALIDTLQTQADKTIIIIEHRLEEVLYQHVDRIILMDDGKIVADMTPDALLATSQLKSMGIREPLYVTLFRFAGIPLQESMSLSDLKSIDFEPLKPALLNWYEQASTQEPLVSDIPILELEGVSFSYDGVTSVLDALDLTIHKQEMVCLVGQNGAGKSTLSKCIAGYLKMTSGTIKINGHSMRGATLKEFAQHVGLVLQNPNQMISKHLIFDEIALGLVYRGVSEEEIKKRVSHVMDVCGLTPFKDWPISALSYGQKKRVTIASILVMEPEILILDEPTAGQDFKHYTEMMQFLVSLNKQGQTIMMITHDMHLIQEYADRCIVLHDHHILEDASPAEVLGDHEVVMHSSLKQTSLYHVAKALELEHPDTFVQAFINEERRRRDA